MAKILVADDNSNIQKMVGLALKDQGIDVVAVGNGEAAVRKISDVRPDLVLADVFMPVRNGYEVCQYVKGDSALAHIPVILLVGAFDPLDEQEAQRVGADGVLKKPFVPPDPLISMVKSALARAGVSIGGAAPPPPVPEEPVRVAEMLVPRSGSSSKTPGNIEPFEFPDHAPTVGSEPVADQIPERPEPVKIDSSSQPLAFGNLLESAGTEEEDADYATTARPQLERDWHAGSEEEAVEEEEEGAKASWRRDAGDESFDEEETSGPVKDWQETAFAETPARKQRGDSWAPGKEKSNYAEAAEAHDNVAAYVAGAPVGETKAASPAAPFAGDAWAAALSEKAPVEASVVAHEVSAAEIPAPGPQKPATSTPWFSSVASPWDAEVQKATQMASTWDAPAAAAPSTSKGDPGATVDVLPAATVEAIREEAQQVAESVAQEPPAAAAGRGTEKTAEPSMDDLVAKVLSKMSPDVLQAVTREILKPVVEAMVREELNSKK